MKEVLFTDQIALGMKIPNVTGFRLMQESFRRKTKLNFILFGLLEEVAFKCMVRFNDGSLIFSYLISSHGDDAKHTCVCVRLYNVHERV